MRVLINSSIYLGSGLLNKAIPFLLLPILTDYLSPEEYGLVAIFQILISFSNPLVGMAIHTNIAKNFFSYSKPQLARLMGNVLWVLSCSTAIVLLLLFLGTLSADSLYSIPQKWILCLPLLSFMFMVNTLNLTILRMEGKAVTFGLYEVGNTAINMGVTILLLVCYHFGWYSRAIGIALAHLFFFGISLFHIARNGYLSIKFDRAIIRQILKLSLPLIPHAVGSAVIAVSDRIFLEKMVNLETVGVYSVGYMFGMVPMLFSEAFVKAWNPWFFKTLTDATPEKKQLVVKYTYWYLAGIVVLCLLVTLAGKWVLPMVVDKAYYDAERYIFWIALGYAFFAVYQIFFPYLVHIGKTAFLAKSTVLAAILNLLLNYFLIRELGAIGAAYSTIIAFFVSSLMVFIYQQKNYKMPWNLLKFSSGQPLK